MTKMQAQALAKDLEGCMEKYKTHPAILLFQPKDSRQIIVFFMGSPSVEWIGKVGEKLMRKLEFEMYQHQFKGT